MGNGELFDKDTQARLSKIVSKARLQFLGLDWYEFTDHRAMHSERVVEAIKQLASKSVILSQYELFLLVASAWLHDMGYVIMGALHAASHNIERLDRTLAYYSNAVKSEGIRWLKHNELSRLFILRNSEEMGLDKSEAQVIADICLAHATRSWKALELPERVLMKGKEVRVLLLAALLRLADALDIQFDFGRLWAETTSLVRLTIEYRHIEIRVLTGAKARERIESEVGSELHHAEQEINDVLARYKAEPRFDLVIVFTQSEDPPLSADVLTAISGDPDLQLRMSYFEDAEKRLKRSLAERGRTLHDFSDMLLNFKRWNSTSPVRSSPSSRGGGLFLIWDHQGIVIDPGYDYVSSLMRGYSIQDIEVVIVTHDHPDHCSDIPKILNLLHDVNQIRIGDGQSPHRIEFYVSVGVHQKYGEMFRSEPNVSESVILPQNPIPLSRFRIDGAATRTQHPETTGVSTGFGVRLKSVPAGSLDIGITGDTAYLPGLEREFDGARFLIAHIGRLRDPVTHGFSDKHLSFAGIVTLVSLLSVTPELIIVSEFGEEAKGDEHRKEVCVKLEEHLRNQGKNVRCIPADWNMCVKIGAGALEVGRAEIGAYHPAGNVRIIEDPATDKVYYD
jgi:phosphoribosyl 1,2-cyclic phosphodiesterase